METLEKILSEHPFFKDFDKKYLPLIVGCASNVRFEPEQLIYREGEKIDQFYLIRQGRVGLEINSPQKGAIVIQTVTEGDILGWSWLVPPFLARFNARAYEPTRAVALDGKCLRTKCEADHELGYEFYRRMTDIFVQRLQATRLQLLDLYGR
jgi:CRP/FNR family transcriptional regulator, cyclic AMP receptor protein